MAAGSTNCFPPSFQNLVHIYKCKLQELAISTEQYLTRRMKNKMTVVAGLAVFMISLALVPSPCFSKSEQLDTFIVFLKKPDSTGLSSFRDKDIDAWYSTFLPDTTTASSSEEKRMVHSYRNVVTGFAARLTEEEVKEMGKKEGFVSAHKEKMYSLHTTRTPTFLGLKPDVGLWNVSNGGSLGGKGVIIGVLDTGIAPDHPSFSDHNMPPPPAKWKGTCQLAKCNNKLIGARNLVSDNSYATDDEGHGTHTSSTAAGNPVLKANAFGQAEGTAIGMAPLAHIAMYKVCDKTGCPGGSILAGLDHAVADGVDVLSLSLGGPPEPFVDDPIAVGAFGAIQKGIFVSCSAGNAGPVSGSSSNEAPWILTVGASTIDRRIKATVLLGNNVTLEGESLFQDTKWGPQFQTLVYAGENGNPASKLCAPGSLDAKFVKGKIVLCERGGDIGRIVKGQEVKDNGGIAMILMNDQPNGFDTLADAHVLPASHVSFVSGQTIKAYINSTESAKATILFQGTVIGNNPNAPQVASFSSRGPSNVSPGILKPDIIGPGVNILAAWPFSVDNSSNVPFNMISGTSMSCPHLSGIAALVKSAHPDWSPAAIKSALMTTSYLKNLGRSPILNEQLSKANLFDIGAGHVNPVAAIDPGLVYDLKPDEYIPYLCGLGYKDSEISGVIQRKAHCGNSSIPEAQLNYPSFAIRLGSNPVSYSRTVTNVGKFNSVYVAKVVAPKGVGVKVIPDRISFRSLNEKATFTVTFASEGAGYSAEPYSHGYLYWFSNDGYSVRSPIAVLSE
ncbi:Subtilisin-like protease 3 [Linum grandiflorum]